MRNKTAPGDETVLETARSYKPPLDSGEVEKRAESASNYEAKPIVDPRFFINFPEEVRDDGTCVSS